jgi:endonuclease/exonuclease/phosphatase family metal-dependent hydrolase
MRLSVGICLFLALSINCTAEDAKSEKTETLKLLTYNVLADDVAVKTRVPALFKILKDSDADIIVLQESTKWFLKLLLEEPWLKKYHLTTKEKTSAYQGEYVILSKQQMQSTVMMQLPGKQERCAFMGIISWNGRSLAVATSHLESFLQDGPMRAKQLDIIFAMMKDADDSILLGDFNFGDGEEPDSSHLDKKYFDVWRELKPKNPGYTWNIEVSDMAKDGSFPKETSRRIDRILVRSDVWKAEAVTIVGDSPVIEGKKDLFPSDHFGLSATLKFKGK